MQTQRYIKDGVILETSRRVPDSLSSDAANVKMDLKSVTVWYSAEGLYDEATHGCNLARLLFFTQNSCPECTYSVLAPCLVSLRMTQRVQA